MDLSIITVCRNAAATLPRCIGSISPLLSKPGLQVEHLIIDGASTDTTPQLLADALRDSRITRYISEPDTGIYNAMNKGLALASGTICVYINADDEIIADAVPACCAPILRGEADYTVSTARIIAADGSPLPPWSPDFSQIWIGVPYCHQTFYCRTELLRQLGGFREDLRIAADTDLIGRLYAAQHPHSIIPVESATFYQGGASAGSTMYTEQLQVVTERATDITAKARLEPAYASTALRQLVFHLNRYFRCAAPGKKDRILLRALKLHRDLAASLPQAQRDKLRARYRRKARINSMLSLLPGRKSGQRRISAATYLTLADFC